MIDAQLSRLQSSLINLSLINYLTHDGSSCIAPDELRVVLYRLRKLARNCVQVVKGSTRSGERMELGKITRVFELT